MITTPRVFDPKILQYLKKPENLALAFQISDYALEIRRALPREFWAMLVAELNKSSMSSISPDKVLFKPPTEAELDESWIELKSVKPVNSGFQSLRCSLEMNNTDEEFYVYMGLRWSHNEKKNSPVYKQPEIADLRNAMESDEDGYQFDAPWWLCGRYAWQTGSRDKFLVEYAESGSSILKATVDAYWRMVERYEQQIAKINKDLFKRKVK